MNDSHVGVGSRPSSRGLGDGLATSRPPNAQTAKQKWGHSALTAAKRRIAAEPDPQAWDGEFHDGCDDFDPDMDEENPFDCIDKLLDQREMKAKQVDNKEEQHDSGEYEGHFEEDAVFSHCNDEFDQSSCGGSLVGGEYVRTSSHNQAGNGVFIDKSNQQITGNVNEKPSDLFHASSLFEVEQNVQSTTRKRTAKQYSIIKSSTPRFTFQSALKPKASTFQTPSNRPSLPQRDLFSATTTTTQKSTKMQRHSFRKSMDRTKTPRVDVRSIDCTPSFLAGKTRKEGISQTSPQEEGLPRVTSTFSSLRKSISNNERQTPRNTKSGYLISRLRSLRNNDQRMAMRLRSGQLSVAGSMARKRRRSGEYLDPKNSSSTELDVTVSSVNFGEGAFGEGKSLWVGCIHRFEDKAGSMSSITLELPCFAWMILSNDVMREQGLVNGTAKQLRFYDAVVIPPRMAMNGIPASELAHGAAAMPTIACTSVCEEYTGDIALPKVSFDRFFTTA